MCKFISWIEYKDNIYFLKNSCLATKEGKKLLKPNVIADLCGHGAIRAYYSELKCKGINKECSNFTSPQNFPAEIVKAISSGSLSKIGCSPDLLNQPALEKYTAIEQPAWEKYTAIEQPAWEKYNAIRQQALEKYNAIRQQALEKYNAIRNLEMWKLFEDKENRNPLWNL